MRCCAILRYIYMLVGVDFLDLLIVRDELFFIDLKGVPYKIEATFTRVARKVLERKLPVNLTALPSALSLALGYGGIPVLNCLVDFLHMPPLSGPRNPGIYPLLFHLLIQLFLLV